MKLKTSLFTIVTNEDTDKGVKFGIHLNSEHIIYKAHFPGQPITPGVCIVQIAQELMEEKLGQSIEIKTVKNVKFLSVISPDEVTDIDYELSNIKEDGDEVKFQATVTSGETVYAKISLICQKQ